MSDPTDIVERLRDWGDKVCHEGADEIERLRAALDEMTKEARDGWSYADDYFQHKWLPDHLLREWFPNNRYLAAPIADE